MQVWAEGNNDGGAYDGLARTGFETVHCRIGFYGKPSPGIPGCTSAQDKKNEGEPTSTRKEIGRE